MKTAWISGGGGYIGSACAEALAKAGAQVAVCDIFLENAEKTAVSIREAGGIAQAYAVDVTDPANVEACMRKAAADFGSLDIMIHVAGGSARIAGPGIGGKPLAEQEEFVIRRVLDVNLFGAIWCSRAAARIMEEQGRGGKIINFSSVLGMQGMAGHADYSAAKGGVIAMTKTLAKELGPYGINVNSVAPGIVMRPTEVQDEQRAYGTNVLHRKCMNTDVANLVAFLCSEQADFVTGQTYVVDGGRSLALKGTD